MRGAHWLLENITYIWKSDLRRFRAIEFHIRTFACVRNQSRKTIGQIRCIEYNDCIQKQQQKSVTWHTRLKYCVTLTADKEIVFSTLDWNEASSARSASSFLAHSISRSTYRTILQQLTKDANQIGCQRQRLMPVCCVRDLIRKQSGSF